MAKSKWTVIDDSKIRMIWACDDAECDSKEMIRGGSEVEIEPSFYQNNGTPVCECGSDMVYVRTEIKQ